MGKTAHIAWKACKILWFLSFYSVKIVTLLTDLRKNSLLFLVFNYSVNRRNMYWVTFTTNAMGRHWMLEELQPGDIWWLIDSSHSQTRKVPTVVELAWWPPNSVLMRGVHLSSMIMVHRTPGSVSHSVGSLLLWNNLVQKKWLPETKIISWVVPGISNTQLRRNSLKLKVVSAIRLTAQFIGTMQPLKHRIVIF